MAEIVEHASSERPLELQLRKRSSGDLVVENVATVLTHSKGSNTARDHGHLGGLLAGKLGSNKFVVRTLYSLSAALHDHAQVDYAVDARSKCRLAGCKQQICQCSLRLGKIPPALKSGHAIRTHWYHVECLFQSFQRMCKSSKIITSVDDIEGFDNLKERDKDRIRKCIANHARGGVDVAGAKVIKTASNLQPDAISNRKSRERSVKLIPTPKNLAPASHVEDDTEDVDLRMPSAAEAEAWWLDAVWSRSSDAATASSSCEDTA